MARTLLQGERQILAGQRSDFLRVEATDPDAVWRDLTNLGGIDWVVGATWGENFDQQVSGATIRLRRAVSSTQSLAPLVQASTINRNSLSAYAPFLDLGRLVRISTAVVPQGRVPSKNSALWSNDLTNSYWTKDASTATQTAPDQYGNANKATKLTQVSTGTSASFPTFTPLIPITGGAQQSFQALIRMDGQRYASLYIGDAAGFGTNRAGVRIDLQTGTIQGNTIVGAGAVIASAISAAGNGYWLVEVTATLPVASTSASLSVRMVNSAGSDFIGDGVSAIDVAGMHFAVDQGAGPSYAFSPTTTTAQDQYREVWHGRVDDVAWQSDPVVLTCSDDGAWLMDAQIEVIRSYGTTGGVSVESQMQQILTDNIVDVTAPTLNTPSSPGWMVKQWSQDRVKVLQALYNLANQIGWDLRYRYDSSGTSKLTFSDPQRTRSSVDDTVGPSEYLDVTRIHLNIADIRNVGVAPYLDSSGARQTTTQSDSASISKYRRRYFELDISKNIMTSTDAQNLINAAVSDLSAPGIEQEIDMLYHWPVQLFDRYTFQQNGDHYDQDQTLAINGYQHTFEGGYGRTVLQCAGKVVGAYSAWLKRIVNTDAASPALTSINALFPDATHAEIIVKGNAYVASIKYATSLGAQPDVTTVRATSPIAGSALDQTIALAVALGQELYVSALGYSGTGGGGTESPLLTFQIKRDGSGLGAPPVCSIDEGAKSRASASLTLRGANGTGSSGTLSWQYSIDGDRTAASWTTPSTAALPQTISVSRNKWAPRTVVLRVTQADGQYTETSYSVDGSMDLYNDSGQIVRSNPYSDGGYALLSSTNDGVSADATVKDARGSALNTHFRYGTDGPPGVIETAGQKFIIGSALDGSRNVDFSGSGFVNKTFDYVARGVTNHPVTDFQSGEIAVDNGNYEAPATATEPVPGWTASGAASCLLDTGSPYSGTQSMKVVATAQYAAATHRRRWRVVPGDYYRVAGAIKSLSASYACEIQLQFFDGAGTFLTSAAASSASTSWAYVDGAPVQVPANAVYALLAARIDGVSGGTGWFDSVTALRVRSMAAADAVRGGGNGTSIGTIVGQLADTGHAGSGMQDSRGSALNTHFRYGTDGAAGVVESGTQKFINGNALDGSRQVDFSSAGVVNRTSNYVARGSSNATPIQTIVQQLADTGHASSTMQDSRGSALNVMFRYGTDALDGCVDSTNYGKTTPTQVTGAGRAATALDTNSRLVDQRRSNMIAMASISSKQSISNALSLAASTGTISISAHTLDMGWGSVSYNSGTMTGWASGLTAGTVIYVYVDDPTFAGGAVTYQATIDSHDLISNTGRYYVGKVTMPSSGTATGGGGGGFRSGAL